jgi:hypothetical protein
VFDFRSLFTLTGYAHTLGPISLIGGFLRTWQVFSLLASDQVAFSHLSTSAHFPVGGAYMIGGLQVAVADGHVWLGPHFSRLIEAPCI